MVHILPLGKQGKGPPRVPQEGCFPLSLRPQKEKKEGFHRGLFSLFFLPWYKTKQNSSQGTVAKQVRVRGHKVLQGEAPGGAI